MSKAQADHSQDNQIQPSNMKKNQTQVKIQMHNQTQKNQMGTVNMWVCILPPSEIFRKINLKNLLLMEDSPIHCNEMRTLALT